MNDIKKPSSVKTVLVLTCICTAIALLVSGVYSLTKEKIYSMKVECNDIIFNIAIFNGLIS